MIKINVYKIKGADKDYYYLSEDEAKATGCEVTTVETHKGSEIALATQEDKPDYASVEEPVAFEEPVVETEPCDPVEEECCDSGECSFEEDVDMFAEELGEEEVE